jgi:hypothetical protein
LRLGEEAIYRYFMVKNQSFCRYFSEGGLAVGFLERGGEVGFCQGRRREVRV